MSFLEEQDCLCSVTFRSKLNVSFGIVHIRRSESMPEGDATLAWKSLVDKFESTTICQCKSDPVEEGIQQLKNVKRKHKILGTSCVK
jgi:hypothetical protein